jgi:hypothetical protein
VFWYHKDEHTVIRIQNLRCTWICYDIWQRCGVVDWSQPKQPERQAAALGDEVLEELLIRLPDETSRDSKRIEHRRLHVRLAEVEAVCAPADDEFAQDVHEMRVVKHLLKTSCISSLRPHTLAAQGLMD